MLRIDTAAMAARVASIPKVGSVRVQRSFPSTVRVTITERAPVLFYTSELGAHLLDAESVEYAIEPPPIGVPELTAEHPGSADPGTRAAVAVVTALPCGAESAGGRGCGTVDFGYFAAVARWPHGTVGRGRRCRTQGGGGRSAADPPRHGVRRVQPRSGDGKMIEVHRTRRDTPCVRRVFGGGPGGVPATGFPPGGNRPRYDVRRLGTSGITQDSDSRLGAPARGSRRLRIAFGTSRILDITPTLWLRFRVCSNRGPLGDTARPTRLGAEHPETTGFGSKEGESP